MLPVLSCRAGHSHDDSVVHYALSEPYADAQQLSCCLQILYTMVAMVVSLTVFAYLLGEISNLVMDQDAELVKIRSQVRSCSTAARHMSLGSSAGSTRAQ